MARLRVGHAGVNSHLHRFGVMDTQACICGDPETIEHFLPLNTLDLVAVFLPLNTLDLTS